MKIDDWEIFKNLSKSCINEFMSLCHCHSLKKKDNLFLENVKVEYIYFLLEGNVVLYKENFNGKKKIIYMIGQGNFINEPAIDESPSAVSCDLFEDSKFLSISIANLQNLFKKYPEFALIFMESMSKKTRRLYRQIKNSSAISMEKKIAAKIWKLSHDYGKIEGEWTKITIKVSNILLAEMLGTNRETISRGLQKLKEKELILYKNGFWSVKRESIKLFYRS